jgi:hypothetical protein
MQQDAEIQYPVYTLLCSQVDTLTSTKSRNFSDVKNIMHLCGSKHLLNCRFTQPIIILIISLSLDAPASEMDPLDYIGNADNR